VKASPAVAKSYAKALFELARERGQTEPIAAELGRAAELMAGDAGLAAVLGRPWIAPATKRQLAAEIGQRLELSALGRDFLALIAAQGRADHLDAIAVAYREMLDAEQGRVRVRVRTAIPLTEPIAPPSGRAWPGLSAASRWRSRKPSIPSCSAASSPRSAASSSTAASTASSRDSESV
jgi:hypothetical protein